MCLFIVGRCAPRLFEHECVRVKVCRIVCVRAHSLSIYLSLPLCFFLSEFGRGSPGAPVAVMACSWLLWYRLGILALMMCKMSKQCLWHLQMAPPWPVLPNCSLIHGNGKHFFKWLPDACIRHKTAHPTHQNNSSPYVPLHLVISVKRSRK